MRLYRPHIPLEARCRVVLRQLGELWPDELIRLNRGRLGNLLAVKLYELAQTLNCSVKDLHLDHDPPLAARMRRTMLDGVIVYSPDANSVAHLIYREKRAHQIKTNVRGEHGQYPDRVLIKRARRLDKPKKSRSPIRGRGFFKDPKRKRTIGGKVVPRRT